MMPQNRVKFSAIFFSSEILLLFATIFAILVANSNYFNLYHDFFKTTLSLDFLGIKDISIKLFIDDFLMVIFFILVGLELKKEVIIGELSSKKKMLLPILAALGGVAFPALIFYNFNFHNAENLRGFAIPTATDIAFTYAIIKAFGNKIPNALKIFIITLAVADDLMAIIIIAFFYTAKLQLFYLFFAFLVTIFLFFLNFRNVKNLILYILCGIFLWFFIMKSGIHPTIAGVILAAFIPYRINEEFLLKNFAEMIAPFVNFFIIPLFAFANAGVKISNLQMAVFFDPLVLGIILGLFLGKQAGISFVSYVLIKLKICNMPKNTNWLEFYAVTILAGIGFTMSLFIANLAFHHDDLLDKVKIGVIGGSLISAVAGSIVLIIVSKFKSLKDSSKIL